MFDESDEPPMTAETCDVYRTGEYPVSGTVVTGIARTLGVEPFDLAPLYDTVDPDALDALFDDARDPPTGGRSYVRFVSNGCSVLVTPDGEVRVRRANT